MTAQAWNGRTPEARAFRAERVIAAAFELASAGGYDAVQMREVASRAGVALATLYRYYPSKDILLAAVIQRELMALEENIRKRPPRQDSPEARAAEVFVRSFRAMQHNRGWAHAAASSYHIPKPLRGLAEGAAPAQSSALTLEELAARAAWGAEHEMTDVEHLGLRMLESLWTSSVIDWLNGRITAAYVERRLRFAAERLLPADSPLPSET